MKLKTTHLFLLLFLISIGGVIFGLTRLDERESPEDPNASPTGPSSLIRGIRRRQLKANEDEQRQRALQVMHDLADASVEPPH